MKKFTKGCLMTALVLFFVGLTISLVCGLLGGFRQLTEMGLSDFPFGLYRDFAGDWRIGFFRSPGYRVHELEELEELEELFALPPEDRVAIHLHYYEGYSTDEIAQILGCRPGTVRSRLSRPRDRLRKLLEL